MEDFDRKNNSELSGFDTAEKGRQIIDESEDNGFYKKVKDDIIQDNTAPNNDTYSKNDFIPNGRYGSYTPTDMGFNSFNKPKKDKKRYSAAIVIVASVLAAVIGAVASTAALTFMDNYKGSDGFSGLTGNNVNINIDEQASSVVEAVALKVTPSVVGIRTTTSVSSFFGGNSESMGEGSGVIYSADGYIITNYHVISEAATNKSRSKIEVFVGDLDSKSYEATVVGYNISSDLAVIKIDATGLAAVEIADSSELKVGQYVITVGNPGGLEFMDSVTYGVISGLNRQVSTTSGVTLIQTDAAINPGNSGGALVNVKGQLVGINSSKIVSEEFEGMGFAIPSKDVIRICKKIIENQNNPEPYVGITISEKYTAKVLEYYGYPSGAVVLSVAEDSPAEMARIKKGDIITEFNGKKIEEYTMFEDILKECTPDEKVKVKLYRSGNYYTTDITIGSNNSISQ